MACLEQELETDDEAKSESRRVGDAGQCSSVQTVVDVLSECGPFSGDGQGALAYVNVRHVVQTWGSKVGPETTSHAVATRRFCEATAC